MQIVISIDIGGTSTKIGLVHPKKGVLIKGNIPSTGYATANDFFSRLFAKIDFLLEESITPYTITGIGIGAPSSNCKEGFIECAANISHLNRVPILSILKSKYKVPAFLVKDSNAAALGEKQYGAATSMDNFILITLGTGLGCGIVINGQVLEGVTGMASELGHIQVKQNGRQCGCGASGCLETYVSATGIKRTAFKLIADSLANSVLKNYSYECLTAKIIYEAAMADDPIAKEAFQFTGKILGQKLADLITIFEPDAIFLAGGLAEAGDLLLTPVIKSIHKHILPKNISKINVQLTALSENEAALLGAASLVTMKE